MVNLMTWHRLLLTFVMAFAFVAWAGGAALAQGQQGTGVPALPENKLRASREEPLKTSSPPPVERALAKTIASDAPDCGANALYVFLRLYNVDCSLDEVRQEVPLTEQGASMLDLKAAAGRHGTRTAVISTPPTGLVERLPAIARMASEGRTEEGHYVVVTRADDELVDLIDGATGVSSKVARATFDREFSGYALVANGITSRSILNKLNVSLLALCGFGITGCVILGLRRFVPR